MASGTCASISLTSIKPARRMTSIKPGAAGQLISIEYSRVRDSSWMYLTSLVTTRIGVELAAVQRKLPNYVIVGFQLYRARTPPGYIRAGRDPLQTIINTKGNKNHIGRRVLRKLAARTCLNLCVPCTIEFQSSRSLPTNPTAKGIPEQAWR